MASIYQVGEVWYISAMENGKRIRESLKTTSEKTAGYMLNDYHKRLDAGLAGIVRIKTVDERIASRLTQAKADGRAPGTITSLEFNFGMIGPFFQRGITQDRVSEFIEQQKADGYALGTINLQLRHLRSIVLPTDNVKIPRLVSRNKKDYKIKFLTPAEMGTLFSMMSPKLIEMSLMYLLTGLRMREMDALEWDDDLGSTIRVFQPKVLNKGEPFRYIPVCQELREILDRRRALGFSTPSGGKKNVFALRDFFALKDFPFAFRPSIKTFRSTFASWMIQSGEPLLTVSLLLGHADVVITARYYAALAPQNFSSAIGTVARLLQTEKPPIS